MPEGDTVFVHAQQLAPRLVGERLHRAFSRWPGVVRGLQGTTVEALEAVGKHLLIGVDDGTTLRVHLGMKGKWSRMAPGGRAPVSRGNVSLRLDTAKDGLVCTKAPTVERFRTRERRVHPVLRRLGPDVLDPDFEPGLAIARLDRAVDAATVSEVLLDQRVSCGIGNVYKSEVCFALGIDPFTPPEALRVEEWRGLYRQSQVWMRVNCRPAPRNTTGLTQPRLWVYGRRGRPCLECHTPILARVHGRDLPRVTYWCPACQPSRPISDGSRHPATRRYGRRSEEP